MTREEHAQMIQSMLSFVQPEKVAEATETLTKLSNDYEETLTANETLASEKEQLTERNEKLRAVNADLFAQVGTRVEPQSHDEDTDADGAEEIPTFDSLFNEKGELI